MMLFGIGGIQTSSFMKPQNKKSNRVKSGYLESHGTGPPSQTCLQVNVHQGFQLSDQCAAKWQLCKQIVNTNKNGNTLHTFV